MLCAVENIAVWILALLSYILSNRNMEPVINNATKKIVMKHKSLILMISFFTTLTPKE